MIFYFSGTGNSLWAARKMAEITQEPLISISEYSNGKKTNEETVFTLHPKERIGFVFPIHSWGPPEIVLHFIRKIRITDYHNNYCYFIATCGDDIGCTRHILRKALHEAGIRLHAGFSLQMPNTYTALPGFNTDPEKIEKEKLLAAEPSIRKIGKSVCRKSFIFEIHTGGMPRLKSYLIRPMFKHYLIKDKYFHVTDACISCGKCTRICPTGNIELQNGRPVWKGDCTACLACYHVCPQQAIYFLKESKKGQYLHPDLLEYGRKENR